MLDERVKFALDNFLILTPPNNSYKISFSEMCYELTEQNEEGKSRLILDVGTENNLCVTNYDGVPTWKILRKDGKFSIRKAVDHFILRKNCDHWELHMVEMKRSVGRKTWFNIKEKVRDCYFTIRALSVFLGISFRDEDIFIYTTYLNDKMDSDDNRASIRLPTGERAISSADEWNNNCITVKLLDFTSEENPAVFPHTRIKMNCSNNDWLEGKFSLPLN